VIFLHESFLVRVANFVMLPAKRQHFPAQVMHLCAVIAHADFRACKMMDIRRLSADAAPSFEATYIKILGYVLAVFQW
jgi:hypothetical protein